MTAALLAAYAVYGVLAVVLVSALLYWLELVTD